MHTIPSEIFYSSCAFNYLLLPGGCPWLSSPAAGRILSQAECPYHSRYLLLMYRVLSMFFLLAGIEIECFVRSSGCSGPGVTVTSPGECCYDVDGLSYGIICGTVGRCFSCFE